MWTQSIWGFLYWEGRGLFDSRMPAREVDLYWGSSSTSISCCFCKQETEFSVFFRQHSLLVIKESLPCSTALVQLSSNLRLPGEQTEVVVRLVRAGWEVASLLCQLLSHGPDMMTLQAAAASNHPHPGLVGLPGKPGRLPPGDLAGLQSWANCQTGELGDIRSYRKGSLATWSSRRSQCRESCSPAAEPSGRAWDPHCPELPSFASPSPDREMDQTDSSLRQLELRLSPSWQRTPQETLPGAHNVSHCVSNIRY